MIVKPLTLKASNTSAKDIVLDGNVFLAPMAGFTDGAFRTAVKDFGYSLKFTELVSAKGLYFGGEGSKSLLYCEDDYNKTAVQIFGSDAYYMRYACESEDLAPFNIVDINMGCPVPKVYKNGEGSALLKDIKKAEEIIKECVKSNKIITVKIRIGLLHGDNIATEFTKMCEEAGASLVTIHGRVREDYYSGEPNLTAIEQAKKSVKIPVIANGGIFSILDAENVMNKTGADGIMLARGAIENPFLVCDLLNKEHNISLKQFIINHLTLLGKLKGENRATAEFRKFVPYYFKGRENIKQLKLLLTSSNSIDEMINALNNSDI